MAIWGLALAIQATIVAPMPEPTSAPAEKIICRRDIETGSRAGAKRRCQTATQWKAEARANADDIERQRGYSRGTH